MSGIALIFVLFGSAFPAGGDLEETEEKTGQKKVGIIYIVGNERTRDGVILPALRVSPGKIVGAADIRNSERNLERMDLFVRHRIELVARENDPEYVDLVVRIEEKSTGRMLAKTLRNPSGDRMFRFLVEERNFDPSRLPTSFDDLRSGLAFRGAGKPLRLEMFVSSGILLQSPRFAVALSFPWASKTVCIRLGSKKSADEAMMDLVIPSVGLGFVQRLLPFR